MKMAEYIVSSGEVSSGIVLEKDSMTVFDGGTADTTTVNSAGKLTISFGGVAENTTLNSRGGMYVSDGGTANSTVVASRGSMYVSDVGTANSTVVAYGGNFYLSKGGTAADTSVSSGGRFTVLSGGTACDTTVNGSGRIVVSSGGTAMGIIVSDGGLLDFAVAPDTLIAGTSGGVAFEIGNGQVSGYTVNAGDTLNVSSGGTADSVTVNGGIMYVETTGTIKNTTLNCGTVYIYNEAIATNITVSSGTFSVGDRGVANTVIVSSGGSLEVFREGIVSSASVSGGELTVSSGGVMSHAEVFSKGQLIVFSLGQLNGATVFSGGSLQVSSGGTVTDTAVSSGDLHVFTGGLANSTTVSSGGRVILESEGTVNHATVGAGCTLKVESGGQMIAVTVQGGGRLLGCFDCGDVTFESGTELYFDVSTITPGNTGALVNLTGLSDEDSHPFKLMISDSQETGVYKLAEGATGFDRTISVVNSVVELGSVSIGQPVKINGKEYSLNLNDDELTLIVSAPTAQYVYLDFDGEELVRYNNPDLGLSIDLSVAAAAFSEEQRAAIVSELAKQYNKYNIAFTLERPEGVEYSTLYFGQSSAFAEYGDFFGIAETHDGNNQIRNDNAFVLLDESYSQGQIVSVASHMLDHLLGLSCFAVDGSPDIKKFAENQTLLSYSSNWIQEDPYNKYCPVDPKTGERCVTGCANNAASQIIYYWLEKGMLDLSLTLENNDAYKCTTGVTIDSSDDPASGHLSFAETNALLGDFQLESIDCIAALCFAAGVIQRAQYSSGETGAFWNKSLFVRAGFDPASVFDKYMTIFNWPECSDSYVNPDTRLADDDFMVNEILQGRPVGISIQSIAHALVVDGYDSARNMFHLNFGWGEDKNRWCTLEELIELQIDEAVCGIAPVVSPDLTVENLAVGTDVASLDEDVTLSFTVSNEGTEVSKETFAYIYCGDTLLGYCGLDYISPGYSRDFTSTINTAPLKEGKNVLTVKVGSQNDEGGISSASCDVMIDNTPPVITLSGNTETAVRQTTLTATVDDGSELYFRISEFGVWKKYTGPIIASFNETYYFKATDEAGNEGTSQITFGNIDTTGILLSTLWTQRGVCPMGGNTTVCYDEYTPFDPSVTPDTHSLVGCVNVAVGQLIYYYIEKQGLDLALTLNDSDEYTSSHKADEGGSIDIEIKSDGTTPGTLSFAAINEYLSDFELDSAEHAAALLYACGVVHKSKYAAASTGASWKKSTFTRSGFKCVNTDGPYMGMGYYYWGYWDDDFKIHISDAGYEVLIENLEAGRSVGAAYHGHALVIDGYDRETDTFHINFGWGYNQATRWYTREGIFELQLFDFVYDLMVDYVETFTVTDARLYGTGTMLRAFEQASGMAGANTVVFDSSVAGKTVELENNIKVTDETTVNGFNMNVLVTSVFTDELPAYGVYSDKGGILSFHASGGSLIVSTSNEYTHAFDMSEALSGTVTADNALIYAGRYSDGAAVVLQSLQESRSGNTEVSDDLIDPNGWSFYGSTGNDVFSLSNSSIAVGNITLGNGDDVLTLAGHSSLYGIIDAGDGNDSITVDSTSSISGDLSGKSKLSFVLTEQEDHALFTVKKSVSDLYSNATLSVDVTDAETGTYTLISAASGATGIEDLQNMVFTVTGSGASLGTLAVGETLSVGNTDYTLKLTDNVLSVAVSETEPAPGKAKWTYLMYFAADNDLDASALDDLISIQRANIDERIDVYVLVDRPEYPWDYEEGEIQTVNGTYRWDSLWTDTRVGKIRLDSGLTVTVDWESWGELDTGSAETLDRFVKWVQAESPAENYALVLWDHGEEFATLCYDFTTDPDLNACLTVSDVSEVVKKNGNIPLVIFNSCLNASDIATTQMAGTTDVMVAPESPSMSSGTTYAYRPFFSTITADMTAREMAEVLVRNVREASDMPYPSMLTAIDVTDIRLADSLKTLAEAVLASGNIEDQNVLIDAMLTAPQRRCLYTGGKVMQSDLKDMILNAKADLAFSGTSEGFRSALAGVESALGAVVLDYRSAPGDSGHSIGFANMIEVSEKYLGLGYTADKVDRIILDYLTTWYGSNPEWADLLHELAGTYLARNTGTRTAVFDVVDNPDLVDGKVVQVNELGCFSGRGETIDGVTLDGDVYFGFTVTAADKSAGGIRVVNDAGVSVSVSLLAGDGSVLATGDNAVAFSDLAVGDYFLRLASKTKCGVTLSFEADWLTGVDRFDYAGSGSNEKHANGNATPDTASVLGAGYYSGLLTSMGDSDFYEFKNTGTDQVRIAVESPGGDCLHVRAFSPKGIPGTGSKYKEGVYTLTMSVGDRLFVEGDANLDQNQVNAYSITVIPDEETPVVLSNLNGTKDGASWKASEVDHLFRAEYSTDDFEHVLSVQTSGWGFDTPELPEGTYQWRVKVLADVDEAGNAIGEDGEWFSGNEIVSDNTPGAPKIVQSNADGNTDMFFASPTGTWNRTYCAKHVGSLDGWTGTNEIVSAKGKGRIQDLFFGSADVNTLYLTDSENGDALFVDDVYTGSPEGIEEKTARLFQISEIYAGAGDDIVDMTSPRFAYTGDLTAIHGGDGNDVIWANSGDNQLFGDAGDDRIIGSSGYDFIVGGIGNDRMHGGGGDDIFTFCENWGTDTVEQLEDGSVLLWFASGSEENWDESTLTYKDGDNSVTVSGVTADQITLKFGNDWSMLYTDVELAGGFLDFSSQRIFEESGILASL